MVTMTKPTLPRLIARLKDICRQEGLQADMKALVALIELTDADIRSCLNTLQVGSVPHASANGRRWGAAANDVRGGDVGHSSFGSGRWCSTSRHSSAPAWASATCTARSCTSSPTCSRRRAPSRRGCRCRLGWRRPLQPATPVR